MLHLICNGRVLNAPITGVQRYALELLKQLPDVEVLAPKPGLRPPFNLLWEQLVLPLKSMGRDVRLWSPCNSGPLAVRNQIITIHDLSVVDFPEEFSRLYLEYYAFLYPRILPRVKAVLAVSEFTKRRLLDVYSLPPEKVHAVPLGVDHQRFRPQPAESVENLRSRLSLPRRYILFLGTLSRRKNIGQLLKAWTRVQSEVDADVHLVIAGGAAAAHVFREVGLPSFPGRTVAIGRVADDDVPLLLAGAEVLVFPSLYEGFGLPALEAMACGTPCIASNVTSLPEVVGDAALTVSPHDVDALADALRRVLTDREYAQSLREKGLRRAALFTWEIAARRTLEVLLQ